MHTINTILCLCGNFWTALQILELIYGENMNQYDSIFNGNCCFTLTFGGEPYSKYISLTGHSVHVLLNLTLVNDEYDMSEYKSNISITG